MAFLHFKEQGTFREDLQDVSQNVRLTNCSLRGNLICINIYISLA